MATTKDLTTLKINYLSKTQYADALSNNQINEDELYLTPADTITLNGSAVDSPSFYAPAGAGTSGDYLKSSGSGAPTWQTPTDSTSASAISTGTALVTERDVYYGLPTINNAHNYTSSTTIYAPAEGGASGYYLKGAGITTAPTWQAPTDSSSASAISTGTALVTERDVYYGLPKINNAHTYTSDTTIYAPISGGTNGYILKATGATSTPEWLQTLPVTNGGTGLTTTTNVNAVVIGNSTTASSALQTVATASGAFYATDTNAKPKFGTLPVSQGGTGGTSFTAGQVIMANASSNTGAFTSKAISPSISITDGDSSNAPKINVTVLGQSGTTAQAITTASTSVYGVTKLSSSTSSTSEALAATPKAVKSAYDLANAAMPKTGGSFTGAVDGAATTAATAQFRNIQIGTAAPSGTAPNGTIYMQYEA